MKQLKTVGRMAALLVIGIFLGVRLYVWNAQSLTGNAVPMPFGVGASVVLSGSMEPTISVGDLLIFTEQEEYMVGDIVVYQSGRTPVVHRIVAMDAETVVTRGDANNTSDAPFALDLVRGKVNLIVPIIGYLFLALKTPIGTLLTVAAAVLLMELSFRKERKEKQSEQDKIKEEIRRLMEELNQQEP